VNKIAAAILVQVAAVVAPVRYYEGPMRPLLVVFAGGASGPWTIQRIDAVIGEPGRSYDWATLLMRYPPNA